MDSKFFLIAGGLITIILTITVILVKRNKVRNKKEEPSSSDVKPSKEATYRSMIAQGNPAGHWYLAELYYSNAQSDQDKILLEAVKHYKAALNAGYQEALLHIADIYNFCNVPSSDIPNKDLARGLYELLVTSSNTPANVKVQANIKLTDLNREKSRTTLENRNLQHGAAYVPPQRNETPQQIVERNNIRLPARPIRVPNAPQDRVRNDSQNVHDSSVQKSLIRSVERLRKAKKYNDKSIPIKDTITQIRQYLTEESSAPMNKRNQAINALDYIEKARGTLSNLGGMSELDVLSLVWSRIECPDNAKNKASLRAALVDQLADCIATGNAPVCTTGRASRIVSSLEVLDHQADLVALKPRWVYTDELNNLAARTRDEVLSRCTADERRAYEGIGQKDDEAVAAETRVTKKIKEAIWNNAREAYVNTNLMTEAEVQMDLKPIMEAI